MKIIVVSLTSLDTGRGHPVRIASVLKVLAEQFGPGSVEWVNVVPGHLGVWGRCRELRREYAGLRVRSHFIAFPSVSVPLVRTALLALLNLRLAAWMFLRYGSGKDLVLLSEMTLSAVPFLLYKKLAGVPLVMDMHGTVDETIQFRPPSPAASLAYAEDVFFEALQLPGLQGLAVVSRRMEELLRSRYGRVPANTALVPICADTARLEPGAGAREAARKELGLEGKFVFVYSGGTQGWQCIDQALTLFKAARGAAQLADLDPRLIFLTWDRAFDLRPRLAAAGIEPGLVISKVLPAQEVGRHLQAADAALVFRENVTTNLVSSPTKVGEYLMSGLPIVCNGNVGDASRIIASSGTGFVTDPAPGMDAAPLAAWCREVHTARADYARRCRETALDEFGPRKMLALCGLVREAAACRPGETPAPPTRP